jgi:chromosome segregation ATPase
MTNELELQGYQVWAVLASTVSFVLAVAVSLLAARRARAAATAAGSARNEAMETRMTQRIQATDARVRQALDDAATTTRGQLEGIRAQLDATGAQLGQTQQALREVGERVTGLTRDLARARTDAALAEAAVRGLKARGHLVEQNIGLAQRELAAADAALQGALTLAPDGLRPRVEEVRRGMGELEAGVEARTFPVAAVEILIDRIYDVMGVDVPENRTAERTGAPVAVAP